MPWLVGTALIHSLAATEKRAVFKTWTVLLAISAFALSLLGGFLVRSGVLTSVHAFAQDPQRGMYILIFLIIVVGGSLALYAVRAQGIKSNTTFSWSSREAMILVNNLLLVVATAVVLLGTLYPLAYEAVSGGKKLSVGPPYFNAVFVPVMVVLFVFMALSQRSRWKNTKLDVLLKRQGWYLIGSMGTVALLMFALATFESYVLLITTIALWIFANLLENIFQRFKRRRWEWSSMFAQPLSYYGMLLGHLGMVVMMIGICCTVYYSVERDLRMAPGDEVELAGYQFEFIETRQINGPNFISDQAEISVTRNGQEIISLFPEKRLYSARGNVMTEADIDPGLFRDLYVALGEPLTQSAWGVRIQTKPFVRWIWIGGLLSALGGIIAVCDKRYRRSRRKDYANFLKI